MSLPSKEAVQGFLDGLGDTEEAVAGALQEMGARDAVGLGMHFTPIIHNCAMAIALRIKFPELNNEKNWATGASSIRLGVDYVMNPEPVADLIDAVDGDRWMCRKNRPGQRRHEPRYPFLLAPEEGS